MRIDVHAHYYPQSYIDLLIELGRQDINKASGQSEDFTDRLAAMDATHTDVQILSSVALDTYLPDVAGSSRACRHINDEYHKIITRHEGRFGAFGQVPLPYVDAAIEEARRCLDDLGFQGVCTPCFYGGQPLDTPEFEPFWSWLNERGAVVYVHPVGSHSACHHGLQQFGLHTAWGSPLQLSATATRLVYSGLTKRHPRIRFIFALCGGYLPYWWTRIETNLRRGVTGSADKAVGNQMFAWVKKLGLDENDLMADFRRFWYDTSVQDVPAAFRCVKEAYGADRLLLGSDEIFASLVESVRNIEESADLTDSEKRAILDENAQKIFCLPLERQRFQRDTFGAYREECTK